MSYKMRRDPRQDVFVRLLGDIQHEIAKALDEEHSAKGLTKADIARLLGKNKAFVTRKLNGTSNMTLKTLADLAWALDREIDLELVSQGRTNDRTNNYADRITPTSSTAQGDMNDKLRNHGLPTPKEGETAEPMSAEERAAEREEKAFKIVVRVMSGVDSVVAMTKQLVQEIERFEAQAEQAARHQGVEQAREEFQAILETERKIARADAWRKALEAVNIAMRLICPDCAKGIPTDKEWEYGNKDGIDRKGLMHPDTSITGALGGGYHKCKAWEVRKALANSSEPGEDT